MTWLHDTGSVPTSSSQSVEGKGTEQQGLSTTYLLGISTSSEKRLTWHTCSRSLFEQGTTQETLFTTPWFVIWEDSLQGQVDVTRVSTTVRKESHLFSSLQSNNSIFLLDPPHTPDFLLKKQTNKKILLNKVFQKFLGTKVYMKYMNHMKSFNLEKVSNYTLCISFLYSLLLTIVKKSG